MDIETEPGTRNWLKQIAEQKSNEEGRYGIPVDGLDEFNLRVRGITSTRR
jgi:hypothetical protein